MFFLIYGFFLYVRRLKSKRILEQKALQTIHLALKKVKAMKWKTLLLGGFKITLNECWLKPLTLMQLTDELKAVGLYSDTDTHRSHIYSLNCQHRACSLTQCSVGSTSTAHSVPSTLCLKFSVKPWKTMKVVKVGLTSLDPQCHSCD